MKKKRGCSNGVSYVFFFLLHCRGYEERISLNIKATVIRILLMGKSHVGVFAKERLTTIRSYKLSLLKKMQFISYKCSAVQFGNSLVEKVVLTMLVVLPPILSDLNQEQWLRWEANTAGPTAALLPENKMDTCMCIKTKLLTTAIATAAHNQRQNV